MFKHFEAKFFIIFSWIVFIFILLLSPFPELPPSEGFTIQDKVVHFFLFGILAFLLNWGSREFRKNRELFLDLTIFLSGSFYVFLTEYLQSFVPGRTPNEWDMVAGILGLIIGLLLANNSLDK